MGKARAKNRAKSAPHLRLKVPEEIFKAINKPLTQAISGLPVLASDAQGVHKTHAHVFDAAYCRHRCHKIKMQLYSACRAHSFRGYGRPGLDVIACRMCARGEVWAGRHAPSLLEQDAYKAVQQVFGTNVYYFCEWHIDQHMSIDILIMSKQDASAQVAVHVDGMHHKDDEQLALDAAFDAKLHELGMRAVVRLHEGKSMQWKPLLRAARCKLLTCLFFLPVVPVRNTRGLTPPSGLTMVSQLSLV